MVSGNECKNIQPIAEQDINGNIIKNIETTPQKYRLNRSKSLDIQEIKDIIEFDEVIQSLILEQSLRSVDSTKVLSFLEDGDACDPLQNSVSIKDDSSTDNGPDEEVDVNFFIDDDSCDNKNIALNFDKSVGKSPMVNSKRSINRSMSLSCIDDATRTSKPTIQYDIQRSMHVMFGDVEERMYSYVLGDRPECIDGPPTSLGWSYQQNEPTDIQTYESQKTQPKRDMKTLRMSKMHREFLLREKGYSRMELNDAMRSVRKSVRDRKITNDFSKFEVKVFNTRSSIRSAAKSVGKTLTLPLKPILKK